MASSVTPSRPGKPPVAPLKTIHEFDAVAVNVVEGAPSGRVNATFCVVAAAVLTCAVSINAGLAVTTGDACPANCAFTEIVRASRKGCRAGALPPNPPPPGCPPAAGAALSTVIAA
ncbi:MAG TPA: hypothetical protein PLT11_07245, partial [Elusimicrobiota bacterium]|nr:hypothetical protein [Elusimicrobiota bacterium]